MIPTGRLVEKGAGHAVHQEDNSQAAEWIPSRQLVKIRKISLAGILTFNLIVTFYHKLNLTGFKNLSGRGTGLLEYNRE